MSKKFEGVLLNSNNMLVTEIDNYYGSAATGSKFNSDMPESHVYKAGRIEHVSDDLPKEWVGAIVFYMVNVGKMINLKELGKYILVDYKLSYLIRLDEKK